MKVPLRWLAEYVNLTLSPRALAERLTMSGSLVEHISNTGSQWDQILVGRIEALDRHPNADTLWLATVNLGDRRQTVVTGAQNLYAGAVIPFIGVGSTLPGQDKPLEARALRGIKSEGMVCSGRELGLNDDHGGILLLNEDPATGGLDLTAFIGQPLSNLLGEWVLELEITPNRPDCLSVFGIAREVAALTHEILREPQVTLTPTTPPARDLASVRIDAPDLCSRFTARVITGVQVGPSPTWLVERLQAVGMRSINNVVDVTNYVMLELGQPLHAYDLDTLHGHLAIARRAQAGERLVTLDGADRLLTPEMLVIADADRPIGIAGVMGGANTEVSETTTRILLEAANFHALSVRRTGIKLGLRSEASSRFEKGLPLALPPRAADRAAALLAELTGGVVAEGVLDEGLREPEPQVLDFSLAEVRRLLGVDWTRSHILGNLEALGFSCSDRDPGSVRVQVPWWRNDIDEQADLVEEVGRITGFDAIPETLLRGSVPPRSMSPGLRWSPLARRVLLASGLSEGSSPVLTGSQGLEMLQPAGQDGEWLAAAAPNPEAVREAGALFIPVRIVNPLTPDREYLRITLLPGLLEALRDNVRNGDERVAFFELDFCTFARPHNLPLERRSLALAMTGTRYPRSWAAPAIALDFYDLKGVVEQLIEGLGLKHASITAAAHPLLHPGRAAQVLLDGRVCGFFGELHPAIAQRWDLEPRRPYVAEFDFDVLAAQATRARSYQEFSRHPVAKRDLAVIVDLARPAEDVVRVIREAARDLLTSVTLFDVYQGEPLQPDQKNIACALVFQASDRTLTEDEVEKIMNRIRTALSRRLGATFRA
jgi:phenylalanyl-tRNA synthetase beta chain